MNTLTWTNGGSGLWTDAANWSGTAAPATGDTMFVNQGVPSITGPISDERIWLNNGGGMAQLNLSGAALDNASFIGASASDGGVTTIFCSGVNSNAGSIQFDSTSGSLHLYTGGGMVASFDNTGQIGINGSAAIMGPGYFTNDATGSIHVVNFFDIPETENFGFSPHFINNGFIVIDGAAATLATSTQVNFSNIAGTGTITITHASVAISGTTDAGSTIGFMYSSGSLQLNLGVAAIGSTITGFAAGDTIDLGTNQVPGLAVTNMAYTPGSGGAPGQLVFAIDQNNIPFADRTLEIAGTYSASDFTLSQVSVGGVADFVVTTSAAPCFAAGTRVRTAAGSIAVEHLVPGDRVLSAFRGEVEVVWIGRRSVDCRHHPRPHDVWPVRVQRGAFGAGLPVRDLYLSPDHAVFADGALVPVRYLLNGASIAQQPVDHVTYFHVELPAHGVIFAEGLPTESYLDTGNRSAFANGPGGVQLHPDFARRVWATEACATLVTSGPLLAALKRRLINRAAALGYGLTGDPALRLLADGVPLTGCVQGQSWCITAPPGTQTLGIMSRNWVPAHAEADSGDHRNLGVVIGAIMLDGQTLDLTSTALATGWHAVEPGQDGAWRWTNGDATLLLRGARQVSLQVSMTGQYWGHESQAAAGGRRYRLS